MKKFVNFEGDIWIVYIAYTSAYVYEKKIFMFINKIFLFYVIDDLRKKVLKKL